METVSIIVPCYNEALNLESFYRELVRVLRDLENLYQFEIIFINDGSKDDTLEILEKLADKDGRVVVISFSRNFGKEAALVAGADFAKGNACIFMDADLQHPPDVLPVMLKKWKEGYKVVNAVRKERVGEGFLKKANAKLFYKLMNLLSDIPIPENVGDFRLLSGEALESFRNLKERRRFNKGLFSWIGFSPAYVEYEQKPRYHGSSKWKFMKLIEFAIEGITSFSIKPLKIASVIGLVISIFSFLYGIYIIIDTLIFGNEVKGWPSLMVLILFMGGLQFIFIGIIGEYIGRIYDEVKQRPIYIVEKIIRGKNSGQKKP